MRKLLAGLVAFYAFSASAQDAIEYQKPPQVLQDLLLAAPTPGVSIDGKGQYMILLERSSYPTIEELAQPELRIAGMRLNPNNFGPSRGSYTIGLKIKNLQTGKEVAVTGLPAKLLAGGVSWNPSQTKFAFSNTTNTGIDLYEVDVKTAAAKKLNKRFLNNVMGSYDYLDDATLMYNVIVSPASAAPKKPLAPKGPVVQQNLGKAAPSRTYQDLIKSPYDEQLFEFYATSQLVINKAGVETNFGKPAIYSSVNPSPDGKYYLVELIKKPFSYLVGAGGFPSEMQVWDKSGALIKTLAKLPSSETAPSGFDNVQNVPRSFNWRADEAATIIWCQPLDSGIMKNKMDYHDEVLALAAPFTGTATSIAKTKLRYRGITWANDTLALLNESSSAKQFVRTNKFNPATGNIEVLIERSTNDAYGNPGTPITTENKYHRRVLQLTNNGKALLMDGQGASPKGDLPFLAVFDLATKQNNIIWRCEEPYYESLVKMLDAEKKVFVTSKQSQTEPANYYIRDIATNKATAITAFTDPRPVLRKVQKQKVSYKRKDGVDLTATLYLPEGYDAKKDGRLPIIMWAYPREFNKASDAAQVRGSQYTFTSINYGSPVFWVTQGYAIMDNAEFPIVAANDSVKSNDNFVDQLEWNAKAAIDKAVEMGFGDSTRVAVGGHSYGAFMTANLLAHTRLFKAGIARSGAYMRTLTPFGFQNEDRTYWQAPDLYYQMSPFSFADKIKDALLLIHGDADNNPGTFPINSERLFNAVKGHGGTVRFVSLPFESHGYAAKENLLHLLWEEHTWLEKYVKNAGR